MVKEREQELRTVTREDEPELQQESLPLLLTHEHQLQSPSLAPVCPKHGLSALCDHVQFAPICGPLDEMSHLEVMTANRLPSPRGPCSTALNADGLSKLPKEPQSFWRWAQDSVTW